MSMYGKYQKIDGMEPVVNPGTDFTGDKGFTVQASRDDADINKILARFQKTGQLPPTFNGEPFYGDVSEIGDLQDCLIKVQQANELFMQYPAELRERFDNDPVKLVDFLGNEDNRLEAEELGLVVKQPQPSIPAEPVEPPASSTVTS